MGNSESNNIESDNNEREEALSLGEIEGPPIEQRIWRSQSENPEKVVVQMKR
jgi:hypothetical protein